jgi:hypothetical protein
LYGVEIGAQNRQVGTYQGLPLSAELNNSFICSRRCNRVRDSWSSQSGRCSNLVVEGAEREPVLVLCIGVADNCIGLLKLRMAEFYD